MRRDRTAVLHFLSQVVRSLAGFGTTLLAARYFGAAGLGVYSQVLALLFWLKLPSNSLKTAIEKRMSESDNVTGHFTAGFLAAVGYGLVIGAIIIVFQQYVNEYINTDAAHLLVFLLLANIAFDLVKSGFIGRRRVAVAGWLGTAEQVLRLASQLALVLAGSMVIGLVTGHIVSLLVFATLGLLLLRKQLVLPSLGDLNDLRRFAQYSWLGNLQGLALTWMDILVLGVFVADSQVGVYQASWTLASFLALASKSIGKTLFPDLSNLGADQQYDRARTLVGNALIFTGIFLIPGATGALVIGDRILEVYSSEFAIGGTILVILICARTVHAFGSQFVNMLNGLDFPEIAFRVNAVFFTANVVGNVILVYLIGWYGAALATLGSTLIYSATAWIQIRQKVGHIKIPVTEIGYEIMASAVMAAAILLALPHLPRTLYVTIATVFVGATIYGVSLLVLSRQIRSKVSRIVGY